jgi:quercetin dioxygenase-like cupin family protein
LQIARQAEETEDPARQARRVSPNDEDRGGTEVFHAGDQIENPVTGERLIFHETSAETNGERVVFETIVQPGGFVAAAHVHPFQRERFEALAGTLGMRRGKEKVELGPGDVVTVEPGIAHKFWNAGDDEARFVCTVTPALQFERLIATMYTLAAAGKTNKKGMPNPVRLAVIANHHFDDVRLPTIPQKLQKLGLVLGAPVGKLVGFGATYDPVPGELSPAGAVA